jgi:hypothetical protein
LSWDRVAQRLLELYARLAVDRVGRTVAA